MNHPIKGILGKIMRRKLAIASMLVVSVAAFATLGDGKIRSGNPRKSLLSEKTYTNSRAFSLRSGYTYRGNQVINTQNEKYVRLNAVVSYQRGNTTYMIPMKKKVLLDKVIFNPNAASRRY